MRDIDSENWKSKIEWLGDKFNQLYLSLKSCFSATSEVDFSKGIIPYLHDLMEMFREARFEATWHKKPDQIKRVFPFLGENTQKYLDEFNRQLLKSIESLNG